MDNTFTNIWSYLGAQDFIITGLQKYVNVAYFLPTKINHTIRDYDTSKLEVNQTKSKVKMKSFGQERVYKGAEFQLAVQLGKSLTHVALFDVRSTTPLTRVTSSPWEQHACER